MIPGADLEAALRRLEGFERLVGLERLSAGASRETYRLDVVMNGVSRPLALRRAAGDAPSAAGGGLAPGDESRLFAAARHAGVPGPEVLLVLEPGDRLGSGFVMEWISGETLGGRILRSADLAAARVRLARQCGEILARLHAIDVRATGLEGRLETFTPEAIVRRTHSAYIVLDTPQPMIDFTAMWLLRNLPPNRSPALVHGDFRNGNLIIQPEAGLAAVLDWELAHIGDPMRDLGWLMTRSWRFGHNARPVGGFGEAEDLFAGYEAVSGEPVDRRSVAFWEVFGSFWWSVGALSMGQSFRSGADRSVERPVIGRRSSECQIDCVNMLIPGHPRHPQGPADQLRDLPSAVELLEGVRDFLRVHAETGIEPRSQFLSRVSANALDIVMREIALGPDAHAAETDALRALLKATGDRSSLRDRLCRALRDGSMDLHRRDLHAYLRDSVFAAVLIDQPRYAGAADCADPSGPLHPLSLVTALSTG
jgi:aminoglycoside phosphotransferase (APT) family kinase protein